MPYCSPDCQADRHVGKPDDSLEDIYVLFCLFEREITGLKQFSPLVGM